MFATHLRTKKSLEYWQVEKDSQLPIGLSEPLPLADFAGMENVLPFKMWVVYLK